MSLKQENQIPASGTPAAKEEPSVMQVAWRALAAPLTSMMLALGLALVWSSALVVPQGASDADLLARFDYAQAQAIRSLGLHDAVTSWPALMFLLLLLLHGVALLIDQRTRRASHGEPQENRWTNRQSLTVAGDIESVTERLRDGQYGSFYFRQRSGQAPVIWRGLWREGVALVIAGLLVLVVSIPMARVLGIEARVTLAAPQGAPAGSPSSPIATQIRDFRGWVEGETPLPISCREPDPVDPLRRRTCSVLGDATSPEFTLTAGGVTPVGPYELRMFSERPRRVARQSALLLQNPQEGPRVLRGEPGRTYELKDGTRLTAFEGSDGPMVVARSSADARPQLFASGGRGADSLAGRTIAGVPGWRTEVLVDAHPSRPLELAGAALLIVGLLLMTIVPHVEIRLRPAIAPHEGVVVSVHSHNRAHQASFICAALASPVEAATIDPTVGAS